MSTLNYMYFTMFDKLVSSEWVTLNYIFTMFDKLVSSEWVHWIVYIYNVWLISE